MGINKNRDIIGIFYVNLPTDRTSHTTAFDGPVVDYWLDRKIAQTGVEF